MGSILTVSPLSRGAGQAISGGYALVRIASVSRLRSECFVKMISLAAQHRLTGQVC